jgi:hypothetical protein
VVGTALAELKSARLGSSVRMAAAHHNSPPLTAADLPEDVAILQAALADAGFAPASSAGPFDGFDGIWGPETTKAVRQFQQAHGVRPVGGFEAGRKTLSALDALLVERPDVHADLPKLPDDPEDRFEPEPIVGLPIAADPVVCDPPKNDLDAAVATAEASSPSFARALARIRRRGFRIVRGAPKRSETSLAEKVIFIACDASQDDAVVRVLYEVNNADNEVLFEDVRDKSKFRNGEEYAKKVIETESITVMHAARMAEEAGRVYNSKIQGLIRPFLIRTPEGLTFKPGTLDKAHKAVFDEMFRNGKTETGQLARDHYRQMWERSR